MIRGKKENKVVCRLQFFFCFDSHETVAEIQQDLNTESYSSLIVLIIVLIESVSPTSFLKHLENKFGANFINLFQVLPL